MAIGSYGKTVSPVSTCLKLQFQLASIIVNVHTVCKPCTAYKCFFLSIVHYVERDITLAFIFTNMYTCTYSQVVNSMHIEHQLIIKCHIEFSFW